jgi:3,4-dihydroxy 2-butanone 4-phosphate synthase/GTP cyclohydrolase II
MVAAAMTAMGDGEVVLIVDHAGVGYLAAAAERVRPELLSVFATTGLGPIRLALTRERCEELGFALTSETGRDSTVASVDAADLDGDASTGLARSRTIEIASDPARGRSEIVEGGQVNVAMACAEGVLGRARPAEAAVDLARLAGCFPAAIVGTALGGDGSIAGADELAWLARRHRLPTVAIEDLVAYRWRFDAVLEQAVEVRLPTGFGEFRVVAFPPLIGDSPHLALVRGEIAGHDPLLSVHRECRLGNALRSVGCDCRRRLESALGRLGREPRGLLLHLAREFEGAEPGLGFGHLGDDQDLDDGPSRSDGLVAQILTSLGVGSVRLMDPGQGEASSLRRFGVRVAGARLGRV